MSGYEPLKTLPEGGEPRAWLLDQEARVKAQGFSPEHDATLASWIVAAPWAHPFWFNYWIYLCHLRPIDRGEGPIPTKFHLEGATHEMWVAALSPEVPLKEQLEADVPAYLTPNNFAAQMIYPSDEVAKQHIERAVRDILAMQLSPDTDFRSQWVARFGSSMVRS